MTHHEVANSSTSLYRAGWARTGATGTIAASLLEAKTVAERMAFDEPNWPTRPSPSAVAEQVTPRSCSLHPRRPISARSPRQYPKRLKHYPERPT